MEHAADVNGMNVTASTIPGLGSTVWEGTPRAGELPGREGTVLDAQSDFAQIFPQG
jgi:hypothetical protein